MKYEYAVWPMDLAILPIIWNWYFQIICDFFNAHQSIYGVLCSAVHQYIIYSFIYRWLFRFRLAYFDEIFRIQIGLASDPELDSDLINGTCFLHQMRNAIRKANYGTYEKQWKALLIWVNRNNFTWQWKYK